MTTNKRYSQHARRAMTYARTLAKQYDHPAIDSTHLLLGIMHEEGSLGATILQELHIDARNIERSFRQLPQQEHAHFVNADHSAGLTEALRLASDESQWLGQAHIGTEHLLLGLARCGEPRLIDLLNRLKVNPEHIRRCVRRRLQDGITEIGVEQAKRVARLSELSRRALNAAEQIADQMSHTQVGLAHLLLVLAREQRSICAGMLREAGLNESLLEANLSKPRPATGGMLEDVIDHAVNRAESLGSHYTGTDHLLLAMALDPRGIRLLRKYHADPQFLIEKLGAYFSR